MHAKPEETRSGKVIALPESFLQHMGSQSHVHSPVELLAVLEPLQWWPG